MNIPKQTTLSSTGLRQSRLSSQASDNDFTSKVHGQLIIQKTHSGISSPKKQHEDPSSSGSLFEDQPPPPSLKLNNLRILLYVAHLISLGKIFLSLRNDHCPAAVLIPNINPFQRLCTSILQNKTNPYLFRPSHVYLLENATMQH